jgi:hypothetical protein
MGGFPNGHFYSPVIDPEELRRRADEIWPRALRELPGVDLDLAGQRALLEALRPFAADFDYPEGTAEPGEEPAVFRDGNGVFERLDARVLFCLLRRLVPRRLLEVGSGHSSLLAADVNRRFLGGAIEITCVEPFPREFLVAAEPLAYPAPCAFESMPAAGLAAFPRGVRRVWSSRVQQVGLDPFLALGAGDVLFIDSSHVSKTGSDVNFLLLEVLPRLAPGVWIHLHDIFLPQEYPREWVLDEERSWNEQYLVQALLVHSRAFAVRFGSACAWHLFPELVESVFGSRLAGGSLWLEKRI